MVVNFLYTNTPHTDGVEACRSFLTMNTTDQTLINDIPTLVDFILKHNIFHTEMAPKYANVFMHYAENTCH